MRRRTILFKSFRQPGVKIVDPAAGLAVGPGVGPEVEQGAGLVAEVDIQIMLTKVADQLVVALMVSQSSKLTISSSRSLLGRSGNRYQDLRAGPILEAVSRQGPCRQWARARTFIKI